MAVYDQARRRRSVRKGREKGCWVYVPEEELKKTGISPDGEKPFYRMWVSKRAILVQLYRDP